MKFISFFAGIGGIDLGLEHAGHECVGQSEIDPDALKVLKDHWPDTPQLGDIKEINIDEIPEAELWTGGFPCIDISTAGKRAGIRGPDSGLFFDWMQAVRVVRPKHLLVENVAALLHRGMGEVCGELAESGYDAEWDCIPACAVGAPHRRDRVFIIADTNRARLPARIFREGPTIEFAEDCRTSLGTHVGRSWEAEPGERWLDDGLPSGMAEMSSRLFGNAVVPQVAEYLGRLLSETTKGNEL